MRFHPLFLTSLLFAPAALAQLALPTPLEQAQAAATVATETAQDLVRTLIVLKAESMLLRQQLNAATAERDALKKAAEAPRDEPQK